MLRYRCDAACHKRQTNREAQGGGLICNPLITCLMSAVCSGRSAGRAGAGSGVGPDSAALEGAEDEEAEAVAEADG
jgi:hypothetical protein